MTLNRRFGGENFKVWAKNTRLPGYRDSEHNSISHNTASSLKVLGRCAILVWKSNQGHHWHSISAKKYNTRLKYLRPYLNCQGAQLKCNCRHANCQPPGKRILCIRRGLIHPFCHHNTIHPRSQFAWRAEALARRAGAQAWPRRQKRWKWQRRRRRRWISWFWFFSGVFKTARKSAVIMQNEEVVPHQLRCWKLVGWLGYLQGCFTFRL